MSKFREAPIYEIEGTSFLVDVDRQVLRQTNDQANEISFIDQMRDHGSFYRLLYDLDERKAAAGLSDGRRIVVVDVPPMTVLDPAGVSERFGVPIEELVGRTDLDVIVDPKLLQARIAGQLPMIGILGEQFTFDLRTRELRSTQGPVMNLRSFERSADGSYYEAAYEPILKQVVRIDPKLTEFPDNVVIIRLPNEIKLDPVGMARQYGIDKKAFLRRYPFQRDLKAVIIPLSETNVPAMIRRNREELQQEHKEIKRGATVRNRPHF